MIYADFLEDPDFKGLVTLLQTHYPHLTFGQQGDAWIWIEQRGMKVEIDTMTAIYFQIKSPSQKRFLVVEVLRLLSKHYHIKIYPEPELEAHED